jgi:hypothetical protein
LRGDPANVEFGFVIQLAYLSSTPTPLTDDAIREILEKSRRNNERDQITGLLVYHEGNVLQFLEGEREPVEKLYAQISRDPRHRGIIRLYERQIEERDFPEWNMGFRTLETDALKELKGYSDVLQPGFDLGKISGKSARSLLQVFKRTGGGAVA